MPEGVVVGNFPNLLEREVLRLSNLEEIARSLPFYTACLLEAH